MNLKFWKKDDRKIFKFYDGERTRRVDPMEAWLKLQGHETFDVQKMPAAADAGDVEAQKAMCLAVQEAFGITAYKFNGRETGLSMVECMNLYVDFCQWLDELKKNNVV